MYTVTHVSIKVSDGGHNLITVDQFLDLPFDNRMKLLSTNSLTFLNEDGETIPLVEGVKYTVSLLRSRNQK